MFWGFLLGVLYLGTDDQLLQILHALHLWQENPPHTKKQVLGRKKKTTRKRRSLVQIQTKRRKRTDRMNGSHPEVPLSSSVIT